MFVEHKEVGEEQPAKFGFMKMSSALRIGATKRPQCQVAIFENGASCALGAMYETIYGYPGNGRFGFPSEHLGREIGSGLRMAFPQLQERIGGTSVEEHIYRRNDSGMPREEIADWLESQGY